jgi:hypothetical protein
MQNNDINEQDQKVLELLEDHPMPVADAGFYDQALVRATHKGSRRQRNRWLLTGFGAATVAIWVVAGTLLSTPELPDPVAAIPGVTIAMEEPRTINLVFSSAAPLDAATLTVSLPEGIELQGFPGQREITWETSLNEGKNLLPLTLIAISRAGGELLARLEHDNRDRTFRLRVDVT